MHAFWPMLKAWWARSRWVWWLVLGVGAVILFAVLRGLLSVKPKPGLPPIPPALQEKINKAQEDNLVARITSKAKADEQKKQLEEVMKIDDGAERRKRLAEMLTKV